jgi:2-oxoglutarate ferredoxin oxidoreductase subunit gamma
MKIEVRLSGSGGQGVVLAAIILAEAAGLHDGRNVVQTQSYGVEARGGASRAEVIISDEEIVFPEVIRPDVLLTMNQPSMNKYANSVKENGMLIADSSFVKEIPEVRARIFSLPLTELGRQAGGVIVSNMVALGSLLGLSGVASVESVRKAVLNRVPKGTEEMNVRALELGLQAGTQALFTPSEAEAGVGPGE